jgi:hypothetical protein
MIAFAAKAGSTASDGDSRNSPFAVALVDHLPKPGLDLRKAFGFVRDDVLKTTGNKQEPYVYGSLGGEDVALVPARPQVTGAQANPQNEIRRDYELALQAGDRDAFEAFLQTYPEGFYANLAKVQLKKIAAEETRAAAAEKARLAEQEKTRLVAEGAKKAEQEEATAQAKAAEQARIAAEKARELELAKAAAAEQGRFAAEKAAADKLAAAAEKKAAEQKAAEQKAAEQKAAADAAAKEKQDQSLKVAALPPAPEAPKATSITDVTKSIQNELRRLGCLSGEADGNWTAASERSLALFNRHAGTKLDVKAASIEALDATKAKTARVCPLTCDSGFRADGDRCVKITCGSGFFLNEDNECRRKPEKPIAKRESAPDQPEKPARERAVPERAATPQASGQILCNQQGCRPVRPGCRIVPGREGSGARSGQREACN